MEKKILKKIKKQLQNDRKIIFKELKRIAKEDRKPKGDFDAKFPDLGQAQDDSATEVTLYSNVLPVEHNLELRLLAIEQALERIKNKKYGFCQICKKEIDSHRLEIMPETETCIQCKKKKSP